MPLQTIVRMGFQAGVKPAFDPAAIPENALADARNIDSDEVGTLRLRPGSVPITASLGLGPTQTLGVAFGNLVSVYNRSLWKMAGGTWVPIIQTSIGADVRSRVSLMPWTYSGAEALYLLGGNGVWRSDVNTAVLVTPYTPAGGEQTNLLRHASGSQDTASNIYKATIATMHSSIAATRMAVAYNNTVYLSSPGDPSYWPADQVIQLPDNGGKITGLTMWYGALLIFRDKDLWAFFGSKVDANAKLVIQDSSIGCAAHRTVVSVPGVGIVFLGPDNVYAIQGVTGVADQVKPVPIGDPIKPHLDAARKDGIEFVCATYFNRQYHLSFPEAVEPERVFRYQINPDTRGWFIDTGPRTSAFTTLDNKLYCGNVETGVVYERRGLSDDGVNIPFSVSFKHEFLSLGPARARKIFLFLAGTSTLQHLSAEVISDGNDIHAVEMTVVGRATENLTIGQTPLPIAKIGRFKSIWVYEGRFNARGQFAQVRLASTFPNEEFSIIGYALEFRPRARGKGIRESVVKL